VGVVAVVALFSREREPRYQGRTLSQWHTLLDSLSARSLAGEHVSPAQAEEAAQAIRRIGTNALPLLLKQLQRETSPLRNTLYNLVWKLLPASISESWAVRSLFTGGHDFDAASTFRILGSTAAPAVPELTSLMYSTNNVQLVYGATFCLAQIGKEGLPSLIAALDQPQLPCCREAAHLLGVAPPHPFPFGTDVAATIPPLSKLAANKDPELAAAAIKALGHLRMEPLVAVPALTNSLRATDPRVRQAAVRALCRFGEMPSLVTALSDADESVRRTATNCMALLASEALTNALPSSTNSSKQSNN